MDVATLAKTAVQLAGNLCGVPWGTNPRRRHRNSDRNMREHPKAEASTVDTCLSDKPTYTVLRRSVKDLQHRCKTLLDVLKAEESNGPPTSRRLEGAIVDANEWVVLRLPVICLTDDHRANLVSSLVLRSG
jgi:hypothetical protein